MKRLVPAIIGALMIFSAACSDSGGEGYYGETGQEGCTGYAFVDC
jgi:hypothetical protein